MNKRIELYGDGIGAVEYVQHMGSDLTVTNSARVSFGVGKSEVEEEDEKLIRYLIKHRHTSTLEHNSVTFKFTVPLFIRSQHHRHRTWCLAGDTQITFSRPDRWKKGQHCVQGSYNEISRRYTDENFQFYEPKEFRTQHKSNRQASNEDELIDPVVWEEESLHSCYTYETLASKAIKNHHVDSLELYERLLEKGVCREQARGVLPQNMYTQYYGTVNLNNLIKFIDLRTHEGAQWEIQKVAEACLEIATDLWPITVKAYRDIRGNSEL